MSKRSPNKISSFFNSDQYADDLAKMDDILEEPITVLGVSWRNGQTGQYAVMTIILDTAGTELKVSCGGMAICDALHEAERQRMFPFQCKATKKGRMYIFVDSE